MLHWKQIKGTWIPMGFYLCFSKVKAENGAHGELLSINYVSSAVVYM